MSLQRQRGNSKKHLRRYSDVKFYLCNECGKTFYSSIHLENHMYTHTGLKPFLCSKCGKKFSQAANLYTHEKVHSGVKLFGCPECSASFSRKGDFEKHYRTHTSKLLYFCTFCKKRYRKQNTFSNHLQKFHSDERTFRCAACCQEFLERYLYLKHVESYVSCGYCTKYDGNKSRKSRKYGLENEESKSIGINGADNPILNIHKGKDDHVIIEIRERQISTFPSKLLCKGSNSRSGLRGRKIQIKRKKKYRCTICGKIFSLAKRFSAHIEKHASLNNQDSGNSEAQPVVECSQSSSQKNELQEQAHKNILQCSHCTQTFENNLELLMHKKVIDSNDSSNRSYPCQPSLVKHQKMHGPDSYICSVCGTTYLQMLEIMEHMKIHSGVRSLSCDTSDVKFMNMRYRKNHETQHSKGVERFFQDNESIIQSPSRINDVLSSDVPPISHCIKIEIHDTNLKTSLAFRNNGKNCIEDSMNISATIPKDKNLAMRTRSLSEKGSILPFVKDFVTIEVAENSFTEELA